MANYAMILKINISSYLRAYCEPFTTNRSNLTQYCHSNAQQSTALILNRKLNRNLIGNSNKNNGMRNNRITNVNSE